MTLFVIILALVWIVFYLYEVRKIKWSAGLIARMAMFAAMYFVLGLITLYKLPQGGSLSLVCMLPIMVCGVFYGPAVGMTVGVIAGALNLLTDFYVIHPAQLMLDYFMPYMAYGLCGMFGKNNKVLIVLAGLITSIMAVGCNILSGVVFFASYAGDMNPWIYSITYNMSTNGVESLLAIIVLSVLPLTRLKKYMTT